MIPVRKFKNLCVILNDNLTLAGRIKFTKIKNLTQELQYFKKQLLSGKNIASKLIHHKATLLSPENKKRIIGGYPIQINQQPCMAYLLLFYSYAPDFRGGAAIIGEYWAVTAAHCFNFITDDDVKQKKAFVCSNTSHWRKGFNKHLIIRTYVHEKYNDKITDYDIALVRVKNPFNGKFEKPVKWAASNYRYSYNAKVFVFGWGYTHPKRERISDDLQAVEIRIVDDNTCKERYVARRQRAAVTSRMICAMDQGKDACLFDSGGPLIRNKILIGNQKLFQ
ncbi:hypothetical protein ILUMI_12898 [Ignelater luminosus]|uniref:Peptidase S1 domain-containing protein n=1 Tax=Ignelater luminosus TaxID=2038154 RepID=A0A8K0CTB1_IGNLU|nr:hypothetical protein ILUMI_12898 [Ignelater luminosus]